MSRIHHHSVNLLVYKATLHRLWLPSPTGGGLLFIPLPTLYVFLSVMRVHLSHQLTWAERESPETGKTHVWVYTLVSVKAFLVLVLTWISKPRGSWAVCVGSSIPRTQGSNKGKSQRKGDELGSPQGHTVCKGHWCQGCHPGCLDLEHRPQEWLFHGHHLGLSALNWGSIFDLPHPKVSRVLDRELLISLALLLEMVLLVSLWSWTPI